MANTSQNQAFAAELYPSYPLDAAIEFIQENLSPDDVFSKSDLEIWAADNGFVQQD